VKSYVTIMQGAIGSAHTVSFPMSGEGEKPAQPGDRRRDSGNWQIAE